MQIPLTWNIIKSMNPGELNQWAEWTIQHFPLRGGNLNQQNAVCLHGKAIFAFSSDLLYNLRKNVHPTGCLGCLGITSVQMTGHISYTLRSQRNLSVKFACPSFSVSFASYTFIVHTYTLKTCYEHVRLRGKNYTLYRLVVYVKMWCRVKFVD